MGVIPSIYWNLSLFLLPVAAWGLTFTAINLGLSFGYVPPEPEDPIRVILSDVTLWNGKTRKPAYSRVSARFRDRNLHVLTSDSMNHTCQDIVRSI